jgi:putative acetyltransferase
VRIREGSEADLPALAELYETSVRVLGPERYSPAHVDAWAAFARDREAFRAKVLESTCLVAEEGRVVVGFATLERDGVVGLLYVRADRARQGIGSALLAAAVDLAEERGLRLRTIAGEFSRGLFERFGFTEYETEEKEHNGVVFRRFLMERRSRERPEGV